MKTFEVIRKFIVPADIADTTDEQLRAAGHEGMERFVLWCGVRQDARFMVQTGLVPRQSAIRSAAGLCVRVEGDELHRLNVWLYEHKKLLAVQVHSHPTDAYHSDTDDTFPIVTMLGGLSIVVPDFGRNGIRGERVAFYRLRASGWSELSGAEAGELIQFGD
jgi:hypothetical protein